MVMHEYIYAVLIVVTLLGLSFIFGWRQWQALRGLRAQENLTPEDRDYIRTHARRTLACCVLMVVLAGLLAGSYLSGLDNRVRELGDQRANENASARMPNPDQKQFITFYTFYWIVTILVVLVMVFLALLDLWAIQRFGLRHMRKIQADRRAMIERQVAQHRSQRNGHG